MNLVNGAGDGTVTDPEDDDDALDEFDDVDAFDNVDDVEHDDVDERFIVHVVSPLFTFTAEVGDIG